MKRAKNLKILPCQNDPYANYHILSSTVIRTEGTWEPFAYGTCMHNFTYVDSIVKGVYRVVGSSRPKEL